jgi:hypothetical protein
MIPQLAWKAMAKQADRKDRMEKGALGMGDRVDRWLARGLTQD